MNPLVHILILNWKSPKNVIECAESIQKSTYKNYKIILIDNGSSDQSEEILRSTFPELAFIQTGKNLGYAGGNNIGIRQAYRERAEYIWIVNPDLRVEPNSLMVMIDEMEKDRAIGIMGPRLIEKSPAASVVMDGGSINERKGYEAIHNYIKNEDNQQRILKAVDYVMGCSFLVRTEVFKKIGMFREDFFLYFEEVEFCFRARDRSWKTVICSWAINEHHITGKKTKDDYYLSYRNRLLFSRIRRKFIFKTLLKVCTYSAGLIFSICTPLKAIPLLKIDRMQSDLNFP